MLKWLRVKNLALVDAADVEFGAGFNVITGETGAGKSVLVGAVSLLLGERAGKGVIRTGAGRCEVAAAIAVPAGAVAEQVAAILDAAAIEPMDGELQLRRVVAESGGRAFVNDSPVSQSTLKEIGDILVDIHGANEHQSLLVSATQLELLDRFGGLDDGFGRCAAAWERMKNAERQLAELESNLPSEQEAERLRAEVSEIEKVNPAPGEDAEIAARHHAAAGSRDILDIASKVVFQIGEGEGCLVDRFGDVVRSLREIERLDESGSAPLLEMANDISERLKDLSLELERYGGGVELDEEAFAALEERLAALQRLKRRYGPSLEDVAAHLESAAERLTAHENAAERRSELAAAVKTAEAALAAAAADLSVRRRGAAAEIADKVVAELRDLGFLKAGFAVELASAKIGPRGADKAEFMFSANPGEPLKPLRQVASSGETSRVMLAIKTALADADAVPILVFDEIDVNIGGETAVVVGQKLRGLAARRQVLTISHLPQVAAAAERHFQVSKSVKDGRAVTKVEVLEGAARVGEIARMLGGGEAARRHAEEMLAAGQAAKSAKKTRKK